MDKIKKNNKHVNRIKKNVYKKKNLTNYFWKENDLRINQIIFKISLLNLFFLSLYAMKKSKIKNLLLDYEITIITRNSIDEDQYIISDYFIHSLPDLIYINDIPRTSTQKVYYLTAGTNIVKMVWNNSLRSLDSIFRNISNIISIDLSKFDASNIEDMKNMFHNCNNLNFINFTNFNTSSVKNMDRMFKYCPVPSLDLSSFDTSSVTNMYQMFRKCTKLKNLDLSNFNTSSVTNISSMFSSCYKLEIINISNFDFHNLTNISQMFIRERTLISPAVMRHMSSITESFQKLRIMI